MNTLMKKLLLLVCVWTPLAQAHAVDHRIEVSTAAIITLNYADERPFAHKQYTLTPAGQNKPMQIGETDAQGRIAFVPGELRHWRLKASSADGHGVNREIIVPAPLQSETALPATAASTSDSPSPPMQAIVPTRHSPPCDQPVWLRASIGLALMFGLFGLYQIFLRHRPR